MGETEPENDSEAWKKFFKKHWKMVVFFIIGAVLASIGAVFIFLWHVGNAQSTDLVPSTIRFWTMGHLISFILYLVLWELLFIGIPVAVAAIAGWQWWKRIPEDERKEYHFFEGSRTTSGSGGLSLLHFIVFCIKIHLDGNWDVPFATWTFDYLVYSAIWALIWILIIFGIPIALGLIWWINHEMKHKP